MRRFLFNSRIVVPSCGRPVLALCAVLALSGCGRKGPLEPPPAVSAAAPATAATAAATPSGGAAPTGPAVNGPAEQAALQAAQTRALGTMENPGLIQSPNTVYEESAAAKLAAIQKDKPRPINEPDIPRTAKEKPFILDPLVK